jgi:putative hydrolase of the HAD superfamily
MTLHMSVAKLTFVPRSVQAVILDLDDTLLDHTGSATSAVRGWLPSLGIEPTNALVDAWLTAEARHYSAWLAGRLTYQEQRRERLRDFLPLVRHTPGTDSDLDELFSHYLAHYQASWIPFGDVEAALVVITAAGLRTAILTNGTIDQQNAKLDAIGLHGRVGPVFTAEQLGMSKPAPSTYLKVCTELAVHPSSALHVGDQYELDVVAARAAGLQAVYLDRRRRGPYHERRRITSLEQLSAHIVGAR